MRGQGLERDALAERLGRIAEMGGAIVMAAQAQDIHVRAKADGSPCSDADLRSQDAILNALLLDFPDIPVVSEEADWGTLSECPGAFFLVDPLDGTSDYIAGGREFCINIALVEGGKPVAGAIHAPAFNESWIGGTSARKRVRLGNTIISEQTIRARPAPETGLTALVSRRHADVISETFLASLTVRERETCSSAIKFGLIAEGHADIYPRFAPTMAWDTAAGQAILEAAGGCVLDASGRPLSYRREGVGLFNPGFSAWGDPIAARRAMPMSDQRPTS